MINIAILGYGTVGSGVVEVLETNKKSIDIKAGEELFIKYVLDLKEFPGTSIESKLTKRFEDIIEDDSVEVIVEVMGGLNPAYDFVKTALLKGKSVVTSNKELVARYGPELLEIARNKNINFLFEASVGGGIPIIRPLNKSLTADEIYEITGILNGTTNYILSKMSREGLNFEDVLKEAQELGFAERNPEADIEGYDACRKIAILSSLAYGMHVNFEEIHTEGITKVRLKDLEYAKKLGYQVKLLGISKKINEKAYAMVAPMMISNNHPLSNVHDVFNAIFIKGNVIGDVMFYGSGAGKLPTASAVVADVVDAVKHLDKNIITHWYSKEMNLMSLEEVPSQLFIALEGHGHQDIIEQVFGKVSYIQSDDETVFITEKSTEGELKEKITQLTQVHQVKVTSTIRIEKD
jgi:homoserine dehydrogenase